MSNKINRYNFSLNYSKKIHNPPDPNAFNLLAFIIPKGGFYSEGADLFAISSNRRTLLFCWAWILKFWDF